MSTRRAIRAAVEQAVDQLEQGSGLIGRLAVLPLAAGGIVVGAPAVGADTGVPGGSGEPGVLPAYSDLEHSYEDQDDDDDGGGDDDSTATPTTTVSGGSGSGRNRRESRGHRSPATAARGAPTAGPAPPRPAPEPRAETRRGPPIAARDLVRPRPAAPRAREGRRKPSPHPQVAPHRPGRAPLQRADLPSRKEGPVGLSDLRLLPDTRQAPRAGTPVRLDGLAVQGRTGLHRRAPRDQLVRHAPWGAHSRGGAHAPRPGARRSLNARVDCVRRSDCPAWSSRGGRPRVGGPPQLEAGVRSGGGPAAEEPWWPSPAPPRASSGACERSRAGLSRWWLALVNRPRCRRRRWGPGARRPSHAAAKARPPGRQIRGQHVASARPSSRPPSTGPAPMTNSWAPP